MCCFSLFSLFSHDTSPFELAALGLHLRLALLHQTSKAAGRAHDPLVARAHGTHWLHARMSLSFPFAALLRQAGKKRPLDVEEETSDFFSWFDKENEDEEFIGQPMKEIWEEPVKVPPPLPHPLPFGLGRNVWLGLNI